MNETNANQHSVPPLFAHMRHLLPDSAVVTTESITVGGCDLSDLARAYGTPLYVYDESTLRARARATIAAFKYILSRVSFAVKACATPGVLDVMRQEGLTLDVVSAGEIACALRTGFSGNRLHLHGNAKSDVELRMAVEHSVCVVVDNLEDIENLALICRKLQSRVEVMIRLALALEAKTHPHLQTSGHRSKFGVAYPSRQLDEALMSVSRSKWLCLAGIHTHLGSQISQADVYGRAAQAMVAVARALQDRNFPVSRVGLGGGWAVPYRSDDAELPADSVAAAVTPHFTGSDSLSVAVEPGRALVARAGVALYRTVSVKSTATAQLIAVDGGMGDNPRPALYGTNYTAFAAHATLGHDAVPSTVVGRFCESGDVLSRDVLLPRMARGDVLCIPVSGAYHLSMSSSYNLVPQPAAVMVANGEAHLLTRRATVDDLLAREVFPR
ncbi:MAG: diaminopimelate decarboxylase [Chloroflexota bacterium]